MAETITKYDRFEYKIVDAENEHHLENIVSVTENPQRFGPINGGDFIPVVSGDFDKSNRGGVIWCEIVQLAIRVDKPWKYVAYVSRKPVLSKKTWEGADKDDYDGYLQWPVE